jgi:TolB-like protein/Tfp pilus assembly protein PilF
LPLIDELKRRNVFKVGIAYVAAAWLLLQLTEVLVGLLRLPENAGKYVILLLVIGFPVALFFAWAFELTPDGIKKEKDVNRSQSITTQTGRKLDFMIIGVMAVALAYFAYDKLVLSTARDAAFVEATTQAMTEQTVTESTSAQVDKSIAVLPFINMSDDAGNEYFSEGLSEELLNLLVKIPEMRVAARTSSFSYKGTNTKIAQIGEELNVGHVLEGSVRKSGNQIRITAQLIKTDDGFHLWSQTYDRKLENVFQIQDEIAAAVVEALKVTLLGTIPASRKTSPEVYSLYLQGRYLIDRRVGENLEQAALAFEQALDIDPNFAPAWVGISWAYELQLRTRLPEYGKNYALARNATERALAIDDKLATAWAQLAFLKKKYEWDWEGAKFAVDKAMQLEPNNADVLGSSASLASSLGQLDKSIDLFERSVAFDPLGLASLIALANRYRAGGRYDDALEKYHQVLALNPEYPWVHLGITLTNLLQGNPERALTHLRKASPDSPGYHSIKAAVLVALGEEIEAQAVAKEFLEESAQEAPLEMAIFFANQGDNDEAFKWLEEALEQRSRGLSQILWNDALYPLENDPRYPVFLEKLGLREYWKAMPRK